MPVALPEPSPSTETSYTTESEGVTYATGAYPAPTGWDAADTDSRERTLSEATRIVDQLNFKGFKTDTDQTLEFPRDGDTTVPQAIKDACSEIAFSLLDGVDPVIEFENVWMTSMKYGPVASTFDKTEAAVHVLAGVPSIKAWRKLLPFLEDAQTVQLRRTS